MLNRRLVAVLCLVTAPLAGFPARAQAPSAPRYEPSVMPSTPEEYPPDAVRWSLRDVLRIALENNLDLLSARRDPAVAEQQIGFEDARFDPFITGSAGYTDSTDDSTITNYFPRDPTDLTGTVFLPPATDPAGGDSDGITADATWTQLLKFGGLYSVKANYNNAGNNTISVDQTPAGQFLLVRSSGTNGRGVNFHWEMPLLQGLGEEVTTATLLLARGNFDISLQDLHFRAISTMQEVENAYWDLLAAHAGLRVADESLKLANDLLGLNRKKVEVGTLAPIEITQAEAGVASREENVIVGQAAVENAEDNLRRLLAIPPDDPIWTKVIEATDRPTFEELKVDLAGSLAMAEDHRTEIASAKQRLRNSELSERVARNGVKHSLRLEADYGLPTSVSDLSSPDNPLTASNEISSTRTDADAKDWSLRLTYGYPLGNHQAKANYAISTLTREKDEIALRNVEQNVRVDVRTAVRNVESNAKRVAAARSNSTLQRKTVEAEQKKFDNGMSTSFEVLRIQTDLSNAQFAEINAILDYTKSLADLERAKGTLLEARGLQIQ